MNRLVLTVFVGVALFALGWAAARGGRAEAGVCAMLTPEKLLANPGIAEEYADAMRSGDADQVGRVEHALVEKPALPPGHPPIHHPSIDDRGLEKLPLFGAPGAVTI
jgi:hypothetical protein